ncbi:MAG: hypothetical protein CMH84_00290 [Nocardioides sp.]|nr:hypothetical protein [Nocardioides sp.]
MVSGLDPSELRAAREKAGLTQHELARLVGAAGGERISRWELGTSVPRPDFVVKLARALNIPTRRLIHLDGDVPPCAARVGHTSAVSLVLDRGCGVRAGVSSATAPTCNPTTSHQWARRAFSFLNRH